MTSTTGDASSYLTIGPSGTGYANHTLDELRLLASSIDTGRIEAMQTSFHNIATHLDLVAASLNHLRTTIPDWWQGPTAEATTQKLTQVIARTHQAQDTAQGASTALRLCTQVVATQQAAIQSLPDPPDPTTTPPRSALLAGDPVMPHSTAMTAQRRAYTAAQEEAVRHVNGIAAQYVETTAQLQGLTSNFSEGFQAATSASVQSGLATAYSSETIALPHHSRATEVARPKSLAHPNSSYRPMESTTRFRAGPSAYWEATEAVHQPYVASGPSFQPPTLGIATEPGINPVAPFRSNARNIDNLEAMTEVPGSLSMLPSPNRGNLLGLGKGQIKESLPARTTAPLFRRPDPEHTRPLSALTQEHFPSLSSSAAGQQREPYLRYGEDGRARFGSAHTNSEMTPSRGAQVEPNAMDDERNIYGGPGVTATRTLTEREERGRRPDYLKEPKETWLPDNFAVPYGGILASEQAGY